MKFSSRFPLKWTLAAVIVMLIVLAVFLMRHYNAFNVAVRAAVMPGCDAVITFNPNKFDRAEFARTFKPLFAKQTSFFPALNGLDVFYAQFLETGLTLEDVRDLTLYVDVNAHLKSGRKHVPFLLSGVFEKPLSTDQFTRLSEALSEKGLAVALAGKSRVIFAGSQELVDAATERAKNRKHAALSPVLKTLHTTSLKRHDVSAAFAAPAKMRDEFINHASWAFSSEAAEESAHRTTGVCAWFDLTETASGRIECYFESKDDARNVGEFAAGQVALVKQIFLFMRDDSHAPLVESLELDRSGKVVQLEAVMDAADFMNFLNATKAVVTGNYSDVFSAF